MKYKNYINLEEYKTILSKICNDVLPRYSKGNFFIKTLSIIIMLTTIRYGETNVDRTEESRTCYLVCISPSISTINNVDDFYADIDLT